MPENHPRMLCSRYLQDDKGRIGNSWYAKFQSMECALPMKKSWLRGILLESYNGCRWNTNFNEMMLPEYIPSLPRPSHCVDSAQVQRDFEEVL